MLRVVRAWFFLADKKKKENKEKSVGFFPLGLFGHSRSIVVHRAGPHSQLYNFQPCNQTITIVVLVCVNLSCCKQCTYVVCVLCI